jgi:hypothetical protein
MIFLLSTNASLHLCFFASLLVCLVLLDDDTRTPEEKWSMAMMTTKLDQTERQQGEKSWKIPAIKWIITRFGRVGAVTVHWAGAHTGLVRIRCMHAHTWFWMKSYHKQENAALMNPNVTNGKTIDVLARGLNQLAVCTYFLPFLQR